MASFGTQAAFSAAFLKTSPGWERICALNPDVDDDLLDPVLEGAADFAADILAPLNGPSDREGARLGEDGRVYTPEGFKQVWAAMAEGGWMSVDIPAEFGGMGLPLAVQTAAQTLFDRAAMAFGMLPGSTRCAAMVLAAYADDATKAEWIEALATGARSATICISEADAGSDLGRMRTRAEQDNDGNWRISGTKNWISYGDHDLTEITGHMVLARTGTQESGTRGVSLFLVPSITSAGDRNVEVLRIEEKLGLHASPTCVLEFANSEAILIGEIGRGLPQLFVMIERMRLLTAGQGCGLAHAALDVAQNYALERKQGGRPDASPPAIIAHADVQRQLAEMAGRTYVLNGFLLELATILDLATLEPDADTRADYAALAAWLLPIAKNFGGETGFDVPSRAIQVLGGAGYTQEWPLEQYLRDARILTIFEGTTGMQALDLLHRRLWKDEGRGLEAFKARFAAEIANTKEAIAGDMAQKVCDRLDDLIAHFNGLKSDPETANYGAQALLKAAWSAVSAWMALRLINTANGYENDAAMIAAAGRIRLDEALAEIEMAISQTRQNPMDIAAAAGASATD